MGDARSFSDLSLLNLTILGATIGKSRSLFAYRTSKGVMLIKSTDALIHFDYTRYFHYYRIREVP